MKTYILNLQFEGNVDDSMIVETPDDFDLELFMNVYANALPDYNWQGTDLEYYQMRLNEEDNVRTLDHYKTINFDY